MKQLFTTKCGFTRTNPIKRLFEAAAILTIDSVIWSYFSAKSVDLQQSVQPRARQERLFARKG